MLLMIIMQNKEKNPLFPIKFEDYPKLFDYVLTSKGLVYFNSLKRKYFLQKKLSLDECNKLRLLYVYYATGNRNVEEVSMWQKICIGLDENGIKEKNMLQSKNDLISKNLIILNPNYVEGLYRSHIEFIKS